jgi:hypothetical protein
MSKKLLADADGMGICEYCGVAFSARELPPYTTGKPWCCPECKNELSFSSFGIKINPQGHLEKIKWVGQGGEWVTKKPDISFRLWTSRGEILVSPFIPQDQRDKLFATIAVG